jgi:hypothetical protein
MMGTTFANPLIAHGDDAQHQIRRSMHVLRAWFRTNGWQRYDEQRMLRALHAIDHPGVLADALSARLHAAGASNQPPNA